ncbi:hypothetical protein ACWDWO_18310 [Actinopolymorpha singaporensis]
MENQPAHVRIPPHLAAVVVILAYVLFAWRPPDNPPPPDAREAVASSLAKGSGIAMVLPVRLPAGYNFGRDYQYSPAGPDDDSFDGDHDFGKTVEVVSRDVTFVPANGVQEHGGLPAVELCVEDAHAKQPQCPDPGTTGSIRCRHGQALLTFYVASRGHHDLSAWRTLELTTDLDKVTWLH